MTLDDEQKKLLKASVELTNPAHLNKNADKLRNTNVSDDLEVI